MKVRVDFGRVFPGLVLFLVGLVLLVVLALVALIAFLFSFIAGSGGVLAATLELTVVPALLIAAGIITILTGVSWWGRGDKGWVSGVAKARASEDRMRLSSRAGEVVGVFVTLIVFFFLYENQLRGAAFFAPSFDLQAAFFFYGPLFTGIALSLARAAYGRRNGIRPLDAANAMFLVVAALWLLAVFPFDFARFGEMFPASIQFLFWWLGNTIGRLLFVLAAIGSAINFVYTTVLYISVRHHMQDVQLAPGAPPQPAPVGAASLTT